MYRAVIALLSSVICGCAHAQVPYAFQHQSGSVPASQLDANFAAIIGGPTFTGAIKVMGHGPVVKLTGATDHIHAASGVYMADQTMFASCPFQAGVGSGGCGGPLDTIANNEKKQWLFQGVTNLGATPEWPWTLDESINTGYAAPWVASTSYVVGALTSANGNIYTATTGGASATTGTGPSGTGTGIADGTVVWSYSCGLSAGCNSKLAFNVTTVFGANAGRSWGVSVNAIMAPGFNHSLPAGGFANGMELDFSNNSGSDCAFVPGSYYDHCAALWFFGGGTYQSTSAIIIDSDNSPTTSAYRYPLFLPAGFGKLCGTACVEIDAPGPIGLEFAGDNPGTAHSIATIRDSSHSRDGIQMNGNYDNAVFDTSLAVLASGVTGSGPGGMMIAFESRSNQPICHNFSLQCTYYDSAGDNQLHDTNNSGATVRKLDNIGNEYLGGTLTAVGTIIAGGYQLVPTEASALIGSGVTLAAGANTAAALTVSGAIPGDIVDCAVTVDLQGLILTGYVTSPGTVKCLYTNPTSGTITLASHTVVARDAHH